MNVVDRFVAHNGAPFWFVGVLAMLWTTHSLAQDPNSAAETETEKAKNQAEPPAKAASDETTAVSDADRYGLPEPKELQRHRVAKPIEKPDGPVRLQFKLDKPVRYLVKSASRMGFKDRADLRQIQETSHAVTYTPLKKADDGSVIVEVNVDVAWGQYKAPQPFQVARGRDLLRQARFRYSLAPDGKIADVDIDGQTDPLARPSVEQMATYVQSMQPMLSASPVSEGDQWTQTFVYRDQEGIAHMAGDIVNTYTLKEWRPCRQSMCAFIEIAQEIKAAGKLMDRGTETRGAGTGTGSGWMLFDHKLGQVVKTKWLMTTESSVEVVASGAPSQGSGAKAMVQVQVESTSERIDGPKQEF